MAILTTDQECFDFMKNAIASHGKACVQGMEGDAADNPYDHEYWDQGMKAIRTNTVENIGFGKEVMINVARTWLGYFGNDSTKVDQSDMVFDLEFELRMARDRVINTFTGPIP